MVENDRMVKYGSWAFLFGILIAFCAGLYQAYSIGEGTYFFQNTEAGGWVAWILAVLGVVVGILAFLGRGTITAKEVPAFLMAGIAILVMYSVFAGLTIKPWIGALLQGVSLSMAIFVAPVVGILSVAVIWVVGRDK